VSVSYDFVDDYLQVTEKHTDIGQQRTDTPNQPTPIPAYHTCTCDNQQRYAVQSVLRAPTDLIPTEMDIEGGART
jgi:hypothetical protein